jgi:hypothetical protein
MAEATATEDAGTEFTPDLEAGGDQGHQVATGEGTGESGQGDQGGDLQDRMSADGAWYSSSTGAVVDPEGNKFVNPTTGREFASMAEFNAFVAKTQNGENKQGQPETPAAGAVKPAPMTRSFENIVTNGGKLDAPSLVKLAQVNGGYKYDDSFVPAVKTLAAGQQPATPAAPVDPVQAVQERRTNMETHLTQPIIAIRDELTKRGVDLETANAIVNPIYMKQMALIEADYKAQNANAMRELVKQQTDKELSPQREAARQTKSNTNIERLSNTYYPEGGKDAFFALVNGYQENGKWVRGEAAPFMDFLVAKELSGKTFATVEERNNAYKSAFEDLTADPKTAGMIFDIVHNYFLGRNVQNAYGEGKKKGIAEVNGAKKLIKTKPTSFSAGGGAPFVEDDKSLGSMGQALFKGAR